MLNLKGASAPFLLKIKWETMIPGVEIESDDRCTLCRITNLSDELKQKIRSELSAISVGKAHAESLPEFCSYKNILIQFLERYELKSEDTKKGMIGELLSHLLIPYLFTHLTSLSVLFNKEEKSIKKGFDIIYCDLATSDLWYSEVKSGHRPVDSTCSITNQVLIKRAYIDLKEKLNESRHTLWHSALLDVAFTLGDSKNSSVKDLLSKDSSLTSTPQSLDKNGLLASVLYEDFIEASDIPSLKTLLAQLISEGQFKSLVLFSIQKKTYEAIERFLKQEAQP